jgi:hypothetical protein
MPKYNTYKICEPINDFRLSSWIHEALMNKKDVIEYCMQKSDGRLNSNYVAEVYKAYFEKGT